ncbi:WD40 repeat domain-containing protein [Streptomyces sp. NPDC001351]|uniref:WD40 repeat domain-containing protein n=1 Tax=Streptomyces sp. NPDC001351 TaxID=3364564 RepID=UPI0036C08209
MNVDELVRDALREQAAGQHPAAAGFADRVLAVRRRRRTRRVAVAALTTAAVVAAGIAVPLLDSGKKDVRPSDVVEQRKTKAHPNQSPPRDLIAAGGTALAAYYSSQTVKRTATTAVGRRTYYLLNPRTGKYEKSPKWSWVAVAPGLRTAAVLEQDLPASRIGLLDLASGEVKRWIQVDHGVGGLAFSRDGRQLVATTYSENPDLKPIPKKVKGGGEVSVETGSHRTGFYVIDVASGKARWSRVDAGGGRGFLDVVNSRQDFALTDDGRYVWAGNPNGDIGKEFWDLTGRKVAVPAGYKYLEWFVDAGKSPNGKLVAGDFAGEGWKTASWVVDAYTGKKTKVRGQQLLAWVGNDRLIAWDIGKDVKNEFHNRLVLVTIGSNKEVPLSGFRTGGDADAGRWEPIFAQP